MSQKGWVGVKAEGKKEKVFCLGPTPLAYFSS